MALFKKPNSPKGEEANGPHHFSADYLSQSLVPGPPSGELDRAAQCQHLPIYPDVYVLMRLYCNKLESEADIYSFLNYISDAIESFNENKKAYNAAGGRAILIINDDTAPIDDTSLYEAYIDKRNSLLNEKCGKGDWKDASPGEHVGSAAAIYNLRLFFMNLADQKPDDIAITLDQDDALANNAIISIAERMKKDGIVISSYKTIDNDKLDISDPARHNAHVNEMLGHTNCEQLTSDFYSSFSSLGWTKSLSRNVLSNYVNDLSYFLERRGGAKQYFSDHQSFEDFIDFYVLLFEKAPIDGVSTITHIYKKNADSITSRPSIEAFRDHRTANLITLIDLCYAHNHHEFSDSTGGKCECEHCFTPLKKDYKYGLVRFVAGKVAEIEDIISKRYIDGYLKKGDSRYKEFAEKAHRGYFISKIARLALGEQRINLQDKALFHYASSRTTESGSNFSDLFSPEIINNTPGYSEITAFSSPRYALRKAVEFERIIKGTATQKTNDAVDSFIAKIVTPHKKQQKTIWHILLFHMALLTAFIILIIINFRKEANVFAQNGNAVAAILGLGGAVLTYLLAERSKIKILADNETSQVKLYYYEFSDFIRHLEANVKVLIQIRKEISIGTHHVQNIHFENLKWPISSCLFSDEMAKIIEKTRVDDFTRLKVNIRNINNSAEWLKEECNKGAITTQKLDWEITRYVGYLLNMYYMEGHEFTFPNAEQIDLFIHESVLVNKLTQLFMDYNAEEREEEVMKYLNSYLDDRRMRRRVLV